MHESRVPNLVEVSAGKAKPSHAWQGRHTHYCGCLVLSCDEAGRVAVNLHSMLTRFFLQAPFMERFT